MAALTVLACAGHSGGAGVERADTQVAHRGGGRDMGCAGNEGAGSGPDEVTVAHHGSTGRDQDRSGVVAPRAQGRQVSDPCREGARPGLVLMDRAGARQRCRRGEQGAVAFVVDPARADHDGSTAMELGLCPRRLGADRSEDPGGRREGTGPGVTMLAGACQRSGGRVESTRAVHDDDPTRRHGGCGGVEGPRARLRDSKGSDRCQRSGATGEASGPLLTVLAGTSHDSGTGMERAGAIGAVLARRCQEGRGGVESGAAVRGRLPGSDQGAGARHKSPGPDLGDMRDASQGGAGRCQGARASLGGDPRTGQGGRTGDQDGSPDLDGMGEAGQNAMAGGERLRTLMANRSRRTQNGSPGSQNGGRFVAVLAGARQNRSASGKGPRPVVVRGTGCAQRGRCGCQ